MKQLLEDIFKLEDPEALLRIASRIETIAFATRKRAAELTGDLRLRKKGAAFPPGRHPWRIN